MVWCEDGNIELEGDNGGDFFVITSLEYLNILTDENNEHLNLIGQSGQTDAPCPLGILKWIYNNITNIIILFTPT